MGLPPTPVDPTNPGDPGLPPFGDPGLPPTEDPQPDYPGDVPLPVPEPLEDDIFPDGEVPPDFRDTAPLDDADLVSTLYDGTLPGDIVRDLVDPDIIVPDGTGTDFDNIDPL